MRYVEKTLSGPGRAATPVTPSSSSGLIASVSRPRWEVVTVRKWLGSFLKGCPILPILAA